MVLRSRYCVSESSVIFTDFGASFKIAGGSDLLDMAPALAGNENMLRTRVKTMMITIHDLFPN
jgi:hypothetical protein